MRWTPWPPIRRALRSGVLACALLGIAATAAAEPVVAWIDEAYPPHQFVDPRGEPAGFDVDLLRAVAKAEGLELELRTAPWSEILGRLEAGRIDVNPGVFRSAERERRLDFSVATAPAHYAIFVRDGSGIASRDELENKRVLVNRGGYHEERIRAEQIPVAPVEADNTEQAILRLAAGEADAAVVLNTAALYFIRTHGLRNVRSLPDPLEGLELRFAVPAGREALLLRLNDGLAQVRASGAYDALYDRWFGVLKPPGVPVGRALWVLGASLLALAVVGGGSALWSRSLQREVERRTHELLDSDARLRATLAAARDVGIVVAEAPGDGARILEFSEGAERLFGYARGEVLGRPAGILRSSDDVELHGDSLGSLDPEGRRSRETELLRKTDERFPAFVVTTRLPGDDNQDARLLYVLFDLTERRVAEEAQQRLRERLRKTETMHALGRLAGGIAHDFNNILTAMLGNAQLLSKDLEPGSEPAQRVDEIEEAGRAAADLVRQLLDFARRRPSSRRPTTWNQALDGVQALLARLLPVNIRFEVRPVQEAWRFKMDPSQAQQVVMNLVLNARDAIEGAGRIELRTENRVVDGRPMAVLWVRDDGAGMDTATLEHIFEPFFSTRSHERGTGLGLATAHSIAESCGGGIEVESTPGQGTTFRVSVPRLELREPRRDG
jgi:PAS domain S-box-containing protein